MTNRPRTFPQDLRYALFDFDGVIADSAPLYRVLDQALMESFGYRATEEDLSSYVGLSSEIIIPQILARHGIEVTTAEILARWDADGGVYGNPNLEPSPGLTSLWAALRSLEVQIGVVSTTPSALLLRALNRFQLLTYVDVLVGRESVTRHKPQPDPYLHALACLAPGDPSARDRALVVEDSEVGVAAARAAGIFTICYRGASGYRAVRGADLSIDAFSDLELLL